MHIQPTQDAGRAFFSRNLSGPIVMLNLLRFREEADYSATPDLAPVTPISGEAAYRRYVQHTTPILAEAGGELVFLGTGGANLIGPAAERWDLIMLVRHRSAGDFASFASNEGYLKGAGHRTAALADSRLLPMVEGAAGQLVAP